MIHEGSLPVKRTKIIPTMTAMAAEYTMCSMNTFDM